jgi:hypothetical protein
LLFFSADRQHALLAVVGAMLQPVCGPAVD